MNLWYSWVKVFRIIPEFRIFEADSLKMLKSADGNSFLHLVSVSLKVLHHLSWIF